MVDDITGNRRTVKTTPEDKKPGSPASEPAVLPSLPAQQLSPGQSQSWTFSQLATLQLPTEAAVIVSSQEQTQSLDTKQSHPEVAPADADLPPAAALGRTNAQRRGSSSAVSPIANTVSVVETMAPATPQPLPTLAPEHIAVTNNDNSPSKGSAASAATPRATQAPVVQWTQQAVLSGALMAFSNSPAGSVTAAAGDVIEAKQASRLISGADTPPAAASVASPQEVLPPSHAPQTPNRDTTPPLITLASAEQLTQTTSSSEPRPESKPGQMAAPPKASVQPTLQPLIQPELPALIQLEPTQGLLPADPAAFKTSLPPAKATITSAIEPTASSATAGQSVHVEASQPATQLNEQGGSQQSTPQTADQSQVTPASHTPDSALPQNGAVSQSLNGAAQPAAAILVPTPTSPSSTNSNAHPAAAQNVATPMAATPQQAPEISSARLIQSVGQTDMRVGLHSSEFGNISIHTSATRDLVSAQISLDHDELARTLVTHLPEMQARLASSPAMEIRIDMNGQLTGQGQGTANSSSQDSPNGQQPKSGGHTAPSDVPAAAPRPMGAAVNLGSHANASRLDITV